MKQIETKYLRDRVTGHTITIQTLLNEISLIESSYNDLIRYNLSNKQEKEKMLEKIIETLQYVIDNNTMIVNDVVELSKIIKRASK